MINIERKMNKIKLTKQTKKTIVHGGIGGLAGGLIGVPGLGIVAGVANANKDKIKKFMSDIK